MARKKFQAQRTSRITKGRRPLIKICPKKMAQRQTTLMQMENIQQDPNQLRHVVREQVFSSSQTEVQDGWVNGSSTTSLSVLILVTGSRTPYSFFFPYHSPTPSLTLFLSRVDSAVFFFFFVLAQQRKTQHTHTHLASYTIVMGMKSMLYVVSRTEMND